jgi:hypothetical protein
VRDLPHSERELNPPRLRSDSPLLEWADQRIASMSETDARLLRMLERLK